MLRKRFCSNNPVVTFKLDDFLTWRKKRHSLKMVPDKSSGQTIKLAQGTSQDLAKGPKHTRLLEDTQENWSLSD